MYDCGVVMGGVIAVVHDGSRHDQDEGGDYETRDADRHQAVLHPRLFDQGGAGGGRVFLL